MASVQPSNSSENTRLLTSNRSSHSLSNGGTFGQSNPGTNDSYEELFKDSVPCPSCRGLGRVPKDLSLKRKVEQPQKFRAEQKWFSALYMKPAGIADLDRLDGLEQFQQLIWDLPSRVILDEFGSTPDEMARLCGEDCGGWLMSSHIAWYFQAANQLQDRSLCFCMGVSTPDDLKCIIAERDVCNVEQLVVAVNVGKGSDNTVFVGSAQQPGCHWVLTILELSDRPRIVYCDSKGWDFPADLLDKLVPFSNVFGISELKEVDIQLMHTPAPLGTSHSCDARCHNYPLQECSDVCGIVTVVCGAVAALDHTLFEKISGARAGINRIFLCNPSRYENYLRRVIIHWYIYGLDMSFLRQTCDKTCCQSNSDDVHVRDHSYFCRTSSSQSHSSQTKPGLSKPAAASELAHDPLHTSHTHDEMSSHCSSTTESFPRSDDQISNKRMKSECQNIAGSKKKQKKNPVCCFCNESFTTKQALHKHKQRKHPAQLKQAQENTSSCTCHCQTCDFKCLTLKNLIHHYNSAHHKNIHIAEETFSTEDEFLLWKKSVEKSTSSLFVKPCGKQITKECLKNYFYCNRSGVPENETDVKGKRAFKAQGSCRTGFRCTAYMTTSKIQKNGSIKVEYCLDHTDHLPKLAQTKLSEDLPLHTAGELAH